MSKKLRIAIIEDEPISRAYLKSLIAQTDVEHDIIQELDSVSESLVFFAKNPDLDLIFMDIHLGDGTCFDILKTITIDTPIIFCTTFDTYAIEAFKYNSIDYILKPIKQNDIQGALNKFLAINKTEETDYLMRINKMMNSFTSPEYKKRFLVRRRNKMKVVNIGTVNFFYSTDGQTYLVEKSGNEHAIEFTLERLEELLNPGEFFRINRKMMVNINEIYSVEDYFNSRLKIRLQNSKKELDYVVSRNRVKYFKNWLRGVS